MIIDESHPQ